MCNLRVLHRKVLELIGQHLKATRDRGLILRPTWKFKVDAYLDTGFSWLHGHESHQILPTQRAELNSY